MKKFAILAGALLISSTVSAGSFESWSMADKKGGAVTVVVSFTGDGISQDVGIDFAMPEGYSVEKSIVKVAGSICTANESKIRVVPPSGAGVALSKASVDYCAFSLRAKKGASVLGSVSLKPIFTECAAPSGMQKCGHADSAIN